MFIDEITLHLKAGRGGDGVARWRHEKGKEYGGPSGGNGGKGGDVCAVAVRDIGALAAYRNVKDFEARRGEDGAKSSRRGGDGRDIEVRLPVGSRLTNLASRHSFELLKDGEKALLLRGGKGGLGNEHFKASTNVRPKETTLGEEGEEADFHIELLLVVDVGIIGLPNAGKSSLLNALAPAARSKVGVFPFTTLEPALGNFYGLIMADIPGLIEGAARGRGLGHKFLRHIERTKALIHCVSSEAEDLVGTYEVVRNELGLYNRDMLIKPEAIVLTKTDTISEADKRRKIETLGTVSKNVFAVSIFDDQSIRELGSFLVKEFK